MNPLFKLGGEDEEGNLTGLPHVINWFDRASVADAIGSRLRTEAFENYNEPPHWTEFFFPLKL